MTFITRPMHRFALRLRAINERYEGKRLKLSTGMKIVLVLLRAYLLLLVGLMVYSFVIKL